MNYLNKKLERFFDEQSPYIFCKKGCAKCCKKGTYLFSKIEFNYIMVGFTQLPIETQQKILSKVRKIKELNQENYECPFLINNACSVYDFRGIVCRSYGLITLKDNGKTTKIPCCTFEGLNYANVIDLKTKIVSQEKFDKLGVEKEPLAYNVSYPFLTSKEIEKNFEIDFGDKKPLIDWFKD
jgi:Fe-S-cluster containining protein